MGFLDKVKNLFTDEIEEEPIKSEVIQVEIPSPLKEEKKEEESITDNNIIKNEENLSAPIFFDDEYFKELEQPKKEVKSSYIKETKKEKKSFQPTPIISPVYGVLDKNYNKDDIRQKNEKVVYHTNTSVTIDEVRNKAFGTLEDELESTLFGSNSILFNDEVKEETDMFDELIEEKEDIDIVEDNLVEEVMADSVDESELLDLIDTIYEKGDK